MKWPPVILSGILVFGLRGAWERNRSIMGRPKVPPIFSIWKLWLTKRNMIKMWVKAVYSEEGRSDEQGRLGGKYYIIQINASLHFYRQLHIEGETMARGVGRCFLQFMGHITNLLGNSLNWKSDQNSC